MSEIDDALAARQRLLDAAAAYQKLPSSTTSAYLQLDERWAAAWKAAGVCLTSPKFAGNKNILGELGRSYEPYATRHDDDPSAVSAFQADLARAEQVMKEEGCSAGDGTGIAYGQGATTTLLKHDIESGTTSLEIAAAISKAAQASGWKEPDGSFFKSLGDLPTPGGMSISALWDSVPWGFKLAGVTAAGVIGLRALARVLGR